MHLKTLEQEKAEISKCMGPILMAKFRSSGAQRQLKHAEALSAQVTNGWQLKRMALVPENLGKQPIPSHGGENRGFLETALG